MRWWGLSNKLVTHLCNPKSTEVEMPQVDTLRIGGSMETMKRTKFKHPKKGWSLIDSVARAKTSIKWNTPDQSLLDSVQVGSSVKIGLEHDTHGGERFWCIVVNVSPDGLVLSADNDLIFEHGIKYSDILQVQWVNIIDVFVEPTQKYLFHGEFWTLAPVVGPSLVESVN